MASKDSTGFKVPVFPAVNSPQRVASSPQSTSTSAPQSRQKVMLTPGHSLLDWIRLGNSGKDLTGIGGMKGVIWDDELAKHDKEDDAWVAVRGLVYNVTPYLDFHPGGRDYLMQGAGTDATDLFNSYHQWVNAESMLGKCLVGKLKKRMKTQSSKESVKTSTSSLKPPVFVAPSALPKDTQPRYEWFQKDDSLMIVIYTKWNGLKSQNITMDYENKILRITTRIRMKYYVLNLELDDEIQENYNLKINGNVGKAEIVLKKQVVRKWINVGKPLDNSGKVFEFKDLLLEKELGYRDVELSEITQLTHDVNLYKLTLDKSCRFPVPVGHHVYVDYEVEGVTVQRPYTVVDPVLWTSPESGVEPAESGVGNAESGVSRTESSVNDHIYLMIKIYSDGLFTSALGTFSVGKSISISPADGDFDFSKLEKCQNLLLYAAGTGITPMIRLINYKLTQNNVQSVHLVFFNKTQNDMVWREKFASLAETNDKFKITNVLSQDDSWTGEKGRINEEIVERTLPGNVERILCGICGPSVFTQLAVELLKKKGIKEENIHAFLG